MIDVGITDFYISIPNLSRRKLEAYSTHLFDQWEWEIAKTLSIPDYALSLQVEEGSIKGSGKIAACLGAVYLGISGYGSFISGLQIIREQATTVGDFLGQAAERSLGSKNAVVKVRKRNGTLGALQRLFVKVQAGQITSEQAMREAEAMFGAEAQTSPEFMEEMTQSLREAPLFHRQIPLPLDSAEEELPRQPEKDRAPRKPYEPGWPPPTQFRIEVWRESISKSRNVRVVKL